MYIQTMLDLSSEILVFKQLSQLAKAILKCRDVPVQGQEKKANVKAPKTKAANTKKTRIVMADGRCGLPGVQASSKAADVTTRAQGLGARAHTSSAEVTQPGSKAGMVSLQQV